jgi:hypothetical protein
MSNKNEKINKNYFVNGTKVHFVRDFNWFSVIIK